MPRASLCSMDLEQACVVLGIDYEMAEQFCHEVDADPNAIGPRDLLQMAALRDADDEIEEFVDEDEDVEEED